MFLSTNLTHRYGRHRSRQRLAPKLDLCPPLPSPPPRPLRADRDRPPTRSMLGSALLPPILGAAGCPIAGDQTREDSRHLLCRPPWARCVVEERSERKETDRQTEHTHTRAERGQKRERERNARERWSRWVRRSCRLKPWWLLPLLRLPGTRTHTRLPTVTARRHRSKRGTILDNLSAARLPHPFAYTHTASDRPPANIFSKNTMAMPCLDPTGLHKQQITDDKPCTVPPPILQLTPIAPSVDGARHAAPVVAPAASPRARTSA